jgi:hypothetical protein
MAIAKFALSLRLLCDAILAVSDGCLPSRVRAFRKRQFLAGVSISFTRSAALRIGPTRPLLQDGAAQTLILFGIFELARDCSQIVRVSRVEGARRCASVKVS